MDDTRLKLILAALGGLVFSLIFILLAFVLPLKDNSINKELQAKHTLEEISRGIKEGQYNPPPGEKKHK
jgi:hypothetical protein